MIKITKEFVNKSHHYYFGLSCGVDSMAALHVLKKLRYSVTAIHVNHKMIKEDDEIERKARLFCDDHNIDCFIVDGRTMKKSSTSKEHYAREIRLDSFGRFARSIGEKHNIKIITAHHADDLVESYINRCFSGNPEYIPIPFQTEFDGFTLVRPFLFTSKEDFVGYAARHELIKYVAHDPMNATSRRGFIRDKLLPVMKEQWPGLKKVVKKRQMEFLKAYI